MNDPFETTLPSVHEAVRKSELFQVFDEKLKLLAPAAFPFIAEFGKLRNVVAPQIGETKVLFPEFTPHDEEHHVVKLFQLSDKFFGKVYQQLAAPELFLLACALYAHDWGMAVGTEEKNFLRHGAQGDLLRPSFSPLEDEADRLDAFARAEGLQRGPNGEFPVLDDEQLRSYVRLTHARRSGARVKVHFLEHQAIGNALALICEGHWHDFAILDDEERFPREYLVAGDTVHLLAITLQVRLIDLFHITDDRTPFALWRFVCPTDKRSALEWKKHKALTGIGVIDYQPGRAIKVQGFTEDEEVWAGLKDLRRYCSGQIAGTQDVVARNVPVRYGLNFIKLDWEVATGALLPVDLRFEFERNAMFRILSEDIYEGDRYVFLRELLQNSIDAVRTRRERLSKRQAKSLKKKQAEPSFDTTIHFIAEHQPNGDIRVTCRDNGTGMDEHIIRNYFAVAGVSYYRSQEFERQHLGFEPISRFGIGILSCFMVSDALDVKTYRDPECGPPMAQADSKLPTASQHIARRLHFKIPSIERQFVVKDLEEKFEVGTEIELLVSVRKVTVSQGVKKIISQPEQTTEESQTSFSRVLEISEYLCEIAGFVEFPILIDETWPNLPKPRRTLILHPNCDSKKEAEQFDGVDKIHQLIREYPWQLVTLPESEPLARELMRVETFDLAEVVNGVDYEGWVSLPVPKETTWDFCGSVNGIEHAIAFFKHGDGAYAGDALLLDSNATKLANKKNERAFFGVYRDGILLKEMPIPKSKSILKDSNIFPKPLIFINVISKKEGQPNVARTRLGNGSEHWSIPIELAIRQRLEKEFVIPALALPPKDRFFRLGWLAAVYRLSNTDLSQMIPKEKRPFALLPTNKTVKFHEGWFNPGEDIPFLKFGGGDNAQLILNELFLNSSKTPKLQWVGPNTIVCWDASRAQLSSQVLMKSFSLTDHWIATESLPSRLQFLSWSSHIYSQKVMAQRKVEEFPAKNLSPKEREAQIIKDLELAISTPEKLNSQQLGVLSVQVAQLASVPVVMEFITFAEPFSNYFMDSKGHINMNHPFTLIFFQRLASITLAIKTKKINVTQVRLLKRAVQALFQQTHWAMSSSLVIPSLENIISLSSILVEHGERNQIIQGPIKVKIPTKDEIVPSSIPKPTTASSPSMPKTSSVSPILLGQLVSEWPIEAK